MSSLMSPVLQTERVCVCVVEYQSALKTTVGLLSLWMAMLCFFSVKPLCLCKSCDFRREVVALL